MVAKSPNTAVEAASDVLVGFTAATEDAINVHIVPQRNNQARHLRIAVVDPAILRSSHRRVTPCRLGLLASAPAGFASNLPETMPRDATCSPI
jgi:hypothetical protein